jgi:sulfonate transport system substrate-binding protein
MKPYSFSLLSFGRTLNHFSVICRMAEGEGSGFLRRLTSLTLAFVVLAGSLASARAGQVDQVRLDWAYYNPVSLVLREKGWLEQDLQGVRIEWVQSLGSNKALEFLRGKSIDFGSTAGAAAFIGRANGNPIKAIYVYSASEWTALVTSPTSGISRIEDLKGKRVAVTRGTDPHIFLLRSLASVGLTEKDIEIVPLQHPDGKTALERAQVDAWSGLDPYMAQLEVDKGFKLFFRRPDWNSFGVLDVREAFAAEHPDVTERVLRNYEKARLWSLDHPEEARSILQKAAQLTPEVAAKVWERTNLTNSKIGPDQKQVILDSGKVLKANGIVDPNTDVEKTVAELIDPTFTDRVAAAH